MVAVDWTSKLELAPQLCMHGPAGTQPTLRLPEKTSPMARSEKWGNMRVVWRREPLQPRKAEEMYWGCACAIHTEPNLHWGWPRSSQTPTGRSGQSRTGKRGGGGGGQGA